MTAQFRSFHQASGDEAVNRRSFLGSSLAAGYLIGGAFAGISAAPSTGATPGPVAQTAAGKIRGSQQGKALVFKGIPYGASTEDSGRFMPPRKPDPWTGVRDALNFGPASPQLLANLIPESMAQVPSDEGNGNEDCLHLSVWTPASEGNVR